MIRLDLNILPKSMSVEASMKLIDWAKIELQNKLNNKSNLLEALVEDYLIGFEKDKLDPVIWIVVKFEKLELN